MSQKSINDLNINSITLSNSNYASSEGYTAQENTLTTDNSGSLLVNGFPISSGGGSDVYGFEQTFPSGKSIAPGVSSGISIGATNIPYNVNNIYNVTLISNNLLTIGAINGINNGSSGTIISLTIKNTLGETTILSKIIITAVVGIIS